MLRFAANITMMFNEFEFLDRFEQAAAAGFKGVEMLFPYDVPAGEIAGKLADYNLESVILNLPPGDFEAGDRGTAALPGREKDFEEALDLALSYTDTLGTRTLHIMAGIMDPENEAAMRTFEANLNKACDKADGRDLTILVEPINQRGMPGYFLSDFTIAADLVKRLDRSNLRLQFDVYHRQIIHGDIVMGLREHAPIIGHVQIANVPDRHEPPEGEIDYDFVFQELVNLEYQGWIGCEYFPKAATVDGLGWFAPWRSS